MRNVGIKFLVGKEGIIMADLFNKNINPDDLNKAIHTIKDTDNLDKIVYKFGELHKPTQQNNSRTHRAKLGRKIKEEVIYLDIKDNDSYLNRLLKTLINKANITNKDVYEKLGDRAKGYALLYNLNRNVSEVTWETLIQWSDILELDIDISVKPRKE